MGALVLLGAVVACRACGADELQVAEDLIVRRGCTRRRRPKVRCGHGTEGRQCVQSSSVDFITLVQKCLEGIVCILLVPIVKCWIPGRAMDHNLGHMWDASAASEELRDIAGKHAQGAVCTVNRWLHGAVLMLMNPTAHGGYPGEREEQSVPVAGVAQILETAGDRVRLQRCVVCILQVASGIDVLEMCGAGQMFVRRCCSEPHCCCGGGACC